MTLSSRIQRRKNFWGYLFILPNFLGFVLFMLAPIIMALVFSFTNYDVISQMDFVGEKFFKITVPMIGPTTYFVTLMSLIGSLQVFDQVYIMTNGGPVNATKTVAMYLYQYGFQFYKMGYACAVAYVLFVLVFVVSVIQNRSSKKWAEAVV